MGNIFNHYGLIFRVCNRIFPSLWLSSLQIKILSIKLFPLLFLFMISNVIAQTDTVQGIGMAKIVGDPFNASLIARNRAISNAVSKYRSDIISTQIFIRNNNMESLNEQIILNSKALIKSWEEIQSIKLENGIIKSIVRVYIIDPQKEEKWRKIEIVKKHMILSKHSNLKIKIRELLNAYSVVNKHQIKNIEINEEIILGKISKTLSEIKIDKIKNDNNEYIYKVKDSGRVNESIKTIKIAEDEIGGRSFAYYVMVDLGSLNYELLKLGFNIPSLKIEV